MPAPATVQGRALRGIAIFEAFKGVMVLAASFGLLSLLHHDVRHLAHELIAHLGMNPDGRYPTVLLHYADLLERADVQALVLLAVGYVVLRLIEAYGLWHNLAWGEWCGALSGMLYMPFEIHHFLHRPSAIGALVFVANGFVVGFLVLQLYRRRDTADEGASTRR
ncbi:uncharacterized membrane protein (DUF2068 family) [Paucimonas lemoignei]|uniref:Uncharacterized membrane protein (DUF2068 family) n=1 Tax=Paucimonas lemoignei TaxID=29443 RepID=A0A4R3HPV2_PAULE|nr:DUF2127 domain-containing protein [Paucimonas lemoignei]TCS33784.1 uncharacterized membrane protein (DUF2068 family) [Paucimonas lemoignei]